jgi:predicted nucleotidyltransferase component of viral defense system
LPENSTLIDLIRQRLTSYHAKDALEEEQAIKEILQEVALYSLWRGGFFNVAAFQGGTSLRILHKLPRFSEDLDFILQQPNAAFDWVRYLNPLLAGLTEFGLQSEVIDKSKMDRSIREALLKNDSIGNQLNLHFSRGRSRPTLKIKLEIDINPPAGSTFAYTYLNFPLDFEVCHQDLPSNFALKIHALLCRPYIKGRDWYDFNWYIKQNVPPNLPHLQAALNQFGPWKGQNPVISTRWVVEKLNDKIATIDWESAAADVERFLGAAERESLRLWSARFFSTRAAQLPLDASKAKQNL